MKNNLKVITFFLNIVLIFVKGEKLWSSHILRVVLGWELWILHTYCDERPTFRYTVWNREIQGIPDIQ